MKKLFLIFVSLPLISFSQKNNNTSILKLSNEIDSLKFKDYFDNYKEYMRVINLDEFKKKF